MFKKYLICFITLCSLTTAFKVSARSSTRNTGHSDIIELGFYDYYVGYKLLSEMSKKELDTAYNKVKRKVVGWSIIEINNNIDAWYISEIIFSKSNKSNQVYTFDYSTKHTLTKEVEVSATGTIATKVSGKIKKVTLSGSLDTEGEIKQSTKDYFEEKTSFSVDLMPFTKLTLMVRGDCVVSNGVGKYYVLGIPFSKGTWEYIDFVTEYYEFFEEEL